MEDNINGLTAEQYHMLYLRAFSHLEDIAEQAEQAMLDLAEIRLSLEDK